MPKKKAAKKKNKLDTLSTKEMGSLSTLARSLSVAERTYVLLRLEPTARGSATQTKAAKAARRRAQKDLAQTTTDETTDAAAAAGPPSTTWHVSCFDGRSFDLEVLRGERHETARALLARLQQLDASLPALMHMEIFSSLCHDPIGLSAPMDPAATSDLFVVFSSAAGGGTHGPWAECLYDQLQASEEAQTTKSTPLAIHPRWTGVELHPNAMGTHLEGHPFPSRQGCQGFTSGPDGWFSKALADYVGGVLQESPELVSHHIAGDGGVVFTMTPARWEFLLNLVADVPSRAACVSVVDMRALQTTATVDLLALNFATPVDDLSRADAERRRYYDVCALRQPLRAFGGILGAHALALFPALLHLNLEHNRIGDSGVSALVSALLQGLDGGGGSGSVRASAAAAAAASFPLQTLGLGDCALGTSATKRLGQLLQSPRCRLRVLYVDNNPSMRNGVVHLASGLKARYNDLSSARGGGGSGGGGRKKPRGKPAATGGGGAGGGLQVLGASGCGISRAGIRALAGTVAAAPIGLGLCILDVGGCSVSEADLVSLVEASSSSAALELLIIGSGAARDLCSKAGVHKALVQALSDNRNLRIAPNVAGGLLVTQPREARKGWEAAVKRFPRAGGGRGCGGGGGGGYDLYMDSAHPLSHPHPEWQGTARDI